jgi:hypothetical protein
MAGMIVTHQDHLRWSRFKDSDPDSLQSRAFAGDL